MAKIGVVSVIALALISFFLTTPLSSSSLVEGRYNLGDKIKIDLKGYGSYKMKITTPSTAYSYPGMNNVVLFTPSEVGNYSIELNYGKKTESYTFEVVLAVSPTPQSETANQTPEETLLSELMTKSEVVIGQPVKWIKEGNIALGTRRTKIAIPLDG